MSEKSKLISWIVNKKFLDLNLDINNHNNCFMLIFCGRSLSLMRSLMRFESNNVSAAIRIPKESAQTAG